MTFTTISDPRAYNCDDPENKPCGTATCKHCQAKRGWAQLPPHEKRYSGYSLPPEWNEPEIRSVNPVTGGEKGVKPERFSLIPARPMEEVARVYGYGAQKYTADNWRKGYEWSKAMDALERHYTAFKRREDYDPESKLHHLAHTIFHCLSLMEWTLTHPELDDREGRDARGQTAGAGDGR